MAEGISHEGARSLLRRAAAAEVRAAEVEAALRDLYSATKDLDDDAVVHEWQTLTLAVGNASRVLKGVTPEGEK